MHSFHHSLARLQRSFHLKGLALAWGALTLAPVYAQTVVPDASAAPTLQCLVKSGAAPTFPPRMLEKRQGGFLRVKLVFHHPERAPHQEVLFRSGALEHQEEVERYLNNYRLPCLKPGQSIEAVQEFNFEPDKLGQVHWNDLRHAPKASAAFDHACIRTPQRQISHFEDRALNSNIKRKANGNLIAQLRFNKPDAPPEVQVLYDNGNANWRNSVLSYLEEYRFNCPIPAGEAIVIEQQFSYAASTRSHDYALNDTNIVKFLGAIKDLDQQRVRFDLDSMACPFTLVFGVGMPAMKNRVGQVGTPNANRLEFMAWLETLTLNLGPDVFDQVLGRRFSIAVPCGKINLGD